MLILYEIMAQNKLYGLTAKDFIHPLEERAMQKLLNTKGIEKVVKKFYDLGIEKIIKLQYIGSGIQVTKTNFPELIKILTQTCDVLNVTTVPELYIQRSEELQATTLGVDHPIIVLTSESVNLFNSQELQFILGREIAHIKSNHILYAEIGDIFPQLIDTLSYVTLGISGLISGGIRYALFYWSQMSEYTADRGGLLGCQDTYIAKSVLAKFAGLPEKHWGSFDMEEFDKQAREFEGFTEKSFDKFVRFIYGNNLLPVARAGEIIQWVESGEYNRLCYEKSGKQWIV